MHKARRQLWWCAGSRAAMLRVAAERALAVLARQAAVSISRHSCVTASMHQDVLLTATDCHSPMLSCACIGLCTMSACAQPVKLGWRCYLSAVWSVHFKTCTTLWRPCSFVKQLNAPVFVIETLFPGGVCCAVCGLDVQGGPVGVHVSMCACDCLGLLRGCQGVMWSKEVCMESAGIATAARCSMAVEGRKGGQG